MEHTSEQVAGSTQAQWGGGQFPELGGGWASQGILLFPPERTLTALEFAGLEGTRKNSPERLPVFDILSHCLSHSASGSAEKGVPSPEQ